MKNFLITFLLGTIAGGGAVGYLTVRDRAAAPG